MFHDSVGSIFKGATMEQGKNYLAAVMGVGMKCHWGWRRNDEGEKIEAGDFLKARGRSFQSGVVVGSRLSSGARPNSHRFMGGRLRRCGHLSLLMVSKGTGTIWVSECVCPVRNRIDGSPARTRS